MRETDFINIYLVCNYAKFGSKYDFKINFNLCFSNITKFPPRVAF